MTCTCCSHAEASRIEEALRDGASQREVARQFGLSKDAVRRHVQHAGTATVVPMAARGALLSKDLEVRARAILAAADQAVREAERQPGSIHHLRALRGWRATLRRSIATRRDRYRQAADVVSPVERAHFERSWTRAVQAYQATEGRPGPRLMALEGMRVALDALFKAEPPPGAFPVVVSVTTSKGEILAGPRTIWTSDERLRTSQTVQLELPDAEPT